MFFMFIQFTLVACQDTFNYDSIVIGSLKKREQIPLSHINRRLNGNLSYRKTKDIRNDGNYRGRDDILDGRRDEITFDKIKDDDETFYRRGDILDRKRYEIQGRKQVTIRQRKDDNFYRKMVNIRRSDDAMDTNIDQTLDKRFEQSERELNRQGDYQDDSEKLNQDFRWLTLNNDDGIGIGIN